MDAGAETALEIMCLETTGSSIFMQAAAMPSRMACQSEAPERPLVTQKGWNAPSIASLLEPF